MHSFGGEERRRYPRSKRAIQMLFEDGGPGILNHVDNISESGVLCHTIKPVALMTRTGVVMNLPKPVEYRIETEGIVVRCDPEERGDDHFNVAIYFPKLSEKDREAIRAFISLDIQDGECTKP